MEKLIISQLQKAQKELDLRIDSYYSHNEDGGNWEEKYIIACRVARLFDVDENDLIY